jgi:hypothetical protein
MKVGLAMEMLDEYEEVQVGCRGSTQHTRRRSQFESYRGQANRADVSQ